MKSIKFLLPLLAALLILGSCETLASGALSGALSSIGAGSGSSGSVGTAATAAAADFQSGEVLVSTAVGSMINQYFYVARVLTPASAATKNQAEVVAVSDGSKEWVNYVINSRKATKADMIVGSPVFYMHTWDTISAENYRKDTWFLGYITSTEELYKGRVEVAGDSYLVEYLRVPTDPVK